MSKLNWVIRKIYEQLGYVPPESFEKWCGDRLTHSKVFKASDSKGGRTDEDILNNHNRWVESVKEFGRVAPININFDSILVKDVELEFSESGNKTFNPANIKIKGKGNLANVNISQNVNLKIVGAYIGKFMVTHQIEHKISLKNCLVQEIITNLSTNSNLMLENCWIGKINFCSKSIKNLIVNKGCICSIDCPPPDGENPFTGTVYFNNVLFPTSTKYSEVFKGPQQYRNLRSHLESLQNIPMASLMRAKELEAERESDKGIPKYFSWLYFLISGYGLNPWKPVIIFMVLLLLSILIIYNLDEGGILGLELNFYKGWRENLVGHGFISKFYRSIFLSLQSMLNPLGIFGVNKIVIPKTILGKLWLSVYGITADLVVAFLVSAIRKRFKQL